MTTHFVGRGNLGADPVLRHPETGGERRAVADLRVYFDRPVPDGNGGFPDKGGFWLDVSLWGPAGEAAVRVLRKGMRVAVSGTLVSRTWTSKKTGEEVSRIALDADHVDLDLFRLESVQVRAPSGAGRAQDPTLPEDEEIPF